MLDPTRIPRYAGAAFVVQFVTSLTAGLLSLSILTESSAQALSDASSDAGRLRLVILLEIATSMGIIALTSMLYLALRPSSHPVAILGFTFWIAEAVLLAVSTLGIHALLDQAADPARADLPSVAGALRLHEHATDLDMLFFGVGAVLWYSLMVRTRFVPRWMSIWGLASVSLVLVGSLIQAWDTTISVPIVLYAAYVPFELVIGVWLLVRGAPAQGPRNAPDEPVAAGAPAPRVAVEPRMPFSG